MSKVCTVIFSRIYMHIFQNLNFKQSYYLIRNLKMPLVSSIPNCCIYIYLEIPLSHFFLLLVHFPLDITIFLTFICKTPVTRQGNFRGQSDFSRG